MSRSLAWILVGPVVLVAAGRPNAPAKVQLTIGTLHAAVLTTPRGAGDSTDAPFFVTSVIARTSTSASVLPGNAPLNIHLNQALGARPLTDVSLGDGDSVQVLLSVMESSVPTFGVVRIEAPPKAKTGSAEERVDQVDRLTAPMRKEGANSLGAVSLLITNEGGVTYWRRFDCVSSCKVLTAPSAVAIDGQGQSIGVVELSGSGGTYHMQLSAARAP